MRIQGIFIWIEGAVGFVLYLLLETTIRDVYPVLARSSDTWQSWAFPVIVCVLAIDVGETVRHRRHFNGPKKKHKKQQGA
ncbi:hypothetical protein H0S68_24740 (plasmid) [Serratia sp. AXJ-M]|uniref:hypothetical protein n=1 Tax=Serratia sp. AXJ-M TaxID=2754727 RepID=UPI00397B98D6